MAKAMGIKSASDPAIMKLTSAEMFSAVKEWQGQDEAHRGAHQPADHGRGGLLPQLEVASSYRSSGAIDSLGAPFLARKVLAPTGLQDVVKPTSEEIFQSMVIGAVNPAELLGVCEASFPAIVAAGLQSFGRYWSSQLG
jgi:hypothetical protein